MVCNFYLGVAARKIGTLSNLLGGDVGKMGLEQATKQDPSAASAT